MENELRAFISLYKKQFKQEKFLIMAKIKFNNSIRSVSTLQIGTIHESEFKFLLSAFTPLSVHPSMADAVSEPLETDSLYSGFLPKGNIVFTFKPSKNPKLTTKNIKNCVKG